MPHATPSRTREQRNQNQRCWMQSTMLAMVAPGSIEYLGSASQRRCRNQSIKRATGAMGGHAHPKALSNVHCRARRICHNQHAWCGIVSSNTTLALPSSHALPWMHMPEESQLAGARCRRQCDPSRDAVTRKWCTAPANKSPPAE